MKTTVPVEGCETEDEDAIVEEKGGPVFVVAFYVLLIGMIPDAWRVLEAQVGNKSRGFHSLC